MGVGGVGGWVECDDGWGCKGGEELGWGLAHGQGRGLFQPLLFPPSCVLKGRGWKEWVGGLCMHWMHPCMALDVDEQPKARGHGRTSVPKSSRSSPIAAGVAAMCIHSPTSVFPPLPFVACLLVLAHVLPHPYQDKGQGTRGQGTFFVFRPHKRAYPFFPIDLPSPSHLKWKLKL